MVGNSKKSSIKNIEIYIFTLKIALAIIALILFTKRTWVGEDAFIFFRYVDNLINGHGLVFNIGERVEGFTSPLWVFFLAGIRIATSFELRQISIIVGLLLSTLSILLILLIV